MKKFSTRKKYFVICIPSVLSPSNICDWKKWNLVKLWIMIEIEKCKTCVISQNICFKFVIESYNYWIFCFRIIFDVAKTINVFWPWWPGDIMYGMIALNCYVTCIRSQVQIPLDDVWRKKFRLKRNYGPALTSMDCNMTLPKWVSGI